MTNDTAITEQARAVFLAALMVLSVMVGTVALSGSAAAATTSVELSDDLVQDGETIEVSGEANTNGTVIAFIDANNNGSYDTGEPDGKAVITDTDGGEYTIELSAPSETGEYSVYVFQEEEDEEYTITEDDEGERSATLEVDGAKPLFGAGDDREVDTSTPTLTVPLSDENTSVNASTIEVDIKEGSDGSGESYVHKVNAPSRDDDGISYDSSANEVTIDFTESELKELEDGTYDVNIFADDAAGNSNSTNFNLTVDTEAPTFTLTAPTNAPVASSTETISVEIGDDANASTAEITVDGPGDFPVTNTSDDADADDGLDYSEAEDGDDTFSVNPGSGNISELETGTYTVTVSAEDQFGTVHSDEFTFSVDVTEPVVDGVTTDQSQYTEDDSISLITVDFSEPVQNGSVTADVSADGSPTELNNFVQGNDGDDSVVYTTYDVTDDYDGVENGSAQVVVTAGPDMAGNSLNTTAGENSTTFGIDTVEPKPSIEAELPGTLRGLVDVEEHVSVEDADGNEPKIGWNVDDGETVPIHTPGSVDTTDLPEGNVDINVTVSDANGTVRSTETTVAVDNVVPSVEYKHDDAVLVGNEGGADFDVESLVKVSDNGTEAASFGYTTIEASDDVSALTWADFTQEPTFTVDEDATYVFAAQVNDPGNGTQTLKTAPVQAEVLESTDLSISAERDQSEPNTGSLNVTVVSDIPLDALNVTVETNDEYYSQYNETLTLEQFGEPKSVGEDSYAYDLSYETERDGEYKLSIDNATAFEVFSIENPSDADDSTTVWANSSKPELVDADVSGLEKGQSQVTVTFSEPVSEPSAAAFTFAGDRASVLDVSDETPGDGIYTLTFDSEIQTGDDPKLELASDSVGEIFGDSLTEGNSVVVDSVELELTEGANLVSVPIEAGSVSLDSLDLSDVNAIWVYDGGEWQSYDPSAKENAFDKLEAGQGYVVYADSDTTIDARGFTKPAPSNDEIPDGPAVENLHVGWNLVGHFQEGQQATSHALTTVDYVPEVGVLSQSSQYAFVNATTMEPGNAYWVFVEDSDLYTAVNYADADQPYITNVDVSEDGGDDTVTNGDTVSVSATVNDDNVDTVTADVSGLSSSNSETVDLTQVGDSTTYTGSYTLSSPPASDSDVTVDVTATDGDSNEATASDLITLDTTEPTVSGVQISDTDSNGEVNDGDTVTVTADVTDATSDVDSVTADASAFGAGSSVTLVDDGSGADGTSGDGTYTATITVGSNSAATEGDQSVTVSATDTATNGGSQAVASGTLHVDNTAPSASISAESFDDSTDTYTVFVGADEELDTSTISVDVTDSDTNTVTTLTGFTVADDGDAGTTHSYKATYTVQSGVDTTFTSTLTAAEDLAGNADGSTGDDTSSGVTVDTTAPTKQTVEATAGDTVEVTYDESVSLTTTDQTTGFSVTVDGTTQTVESASVTDSTVTLTLDATHIDSSSTVDVSYDNTESNVQDDAGNAAGSFDETGVSVTAADTAQYSSASTSGGATLQVTLDEGVQLTDSDTTSGFTVTVDGTTATVSGATVMTDTTVVELTLDSTSISSGQTVTVSYDGTNSNLQDADGNPVIVFTDEEVTNNA